MYSVMWPFASFLLSSFMYCYLSVNSIWKIGMFIFYAKSIHSLNLFFIHRNEMIDLLFFFPIQANLPISMEMSLDTFYNQQSQFMFGGRHELNQQTAPQTPQTPSSIPDIVLQGK